MSATSSTTQGRRRPRRHQPCGVGFARLRRRHRWLQANLSGYLDWARTHNSLLVVTVDESDAQLGSNHIITLFDGAALRPGRYDEPIDHYWLLRTIEEIYHIPALGKAASTTPITDVWAGAAPH